MRSLCDDASHMGVITGRGLRKTYASDGAAVRALDGVDVDVAKGEFLAIMGPSGSGKSTLLHVLGALDVPDEGRVEIDGAPLDTLSGTELARIRRRELGFVFQFFNLVPVLTVEENVTLPAVLEGTSADTYGPRVDRILDDLGLTNRRDKLPPQLSGGEQQRVAIARALVNEPKVILADEPTGNLDRASGSDVMDMLMRLNGAGQTIVVVTHDAVVAAHAKRVVFMRDGALIDEAVLDGSGDATAVLARLSALDA